MDLRGPVCARLVELLGQGPQRIGAEAFGVLVLLSDGCQRIARDTPIVFLKLGSKLKRQSFEVACAFVGCSLLC